MYDLPTTADYAQNAAQHAQDDITELRRLVENLYRHLGVPLPEPPKPEFLDPIKAVTDETARALIQRLTELSR